MSAVSPKSGSRRRRAPARPGVLRKLRNQGGATVLSIPIHFLAELGIAAGADVEVTLVDGKLVAEPKRQTAPCRRRYTIAELLEGAEHLPQLYAGTVGALDGPPVGQEMG